MNVRIRSLRCALMSVKACLHIDTKMGGVLARVLTIVRALLFMRMMVGTYMHVLMRVCAVASMAAGVSAEASMPMRVRAMVNTPMRVRVTTRVRARARRHVCTCICAGTGLRVGRRALRDRF